MHTGLPIQSCIALTCNNNLSSDPNSVPHLSVLASDAQAFQCALKFNKHSFCLLTWAAAMVKAHLVMHASHI